MAISGEQYEQVRQLATAQDRSIAATVRVLLAAPLQREMAKLEKRRAEAKAA